MKIEIFFSLDGLNYLNPSKHTLSIQITQNTNKLNMSTYTVTASVATHKKVFSQFGSELRDNLTRGLEGNFSAEVVNDIQEKFDVAFDTVLAQVGKKSAAAPKKAKNPSKPNKNEEKRNKLIAEAAELGIEVADEKIGEIRKMISAHKKAQKKAAAEAKKAEKKAAAEAKKAEKKAAAEAKKAEKKAAQKALQSVAAEKASADESKYLCIRGSVDSIWNVREIQTTEPRAVSGELHEGVPDGYFPTLDREARVQAEMDQIRASANECCHAVVRERIADTNSFQFSHFCAVRCQLGCTLVG